MWVMDKDWEWFASKDGIIDAKKQTFGIKPIEGNQKKKYIWVKAKNSWWKVCIILRESGGRYWEISWWAARCDDEG